MYSVCGKKGIEMISIITPTYNRAGYLTRLKNSLMQQTCDKFEWIIVDDGSEDNTKEIIEGWGGISIPYIYLYKGKLRELFTKKGRDVVWSSGQELVSADTFSVTKQKEDLLQIELSGDGQEELLYIRIYGEDSK